MKRLGLREIAKLANVSLGTVDRALHGRKGITDETRDRILSIANSLGYTPDLAARALSVGRAPIRVGVSIPREIRYYFDQLLAGIVAEARRYRSLGAQVLYSPTQRLGHDEAERAQDLVNRGVDVLIVAPGDPASLAPVIDAAEAKGIRVICVDTDAPGSKRSTLVSVDPEVCGRMAAELMGTVLPAGSEAAVFTGMLGIEDHARKTDAFRAAFEGFNSGGRTGEVIEAHEDEEEAFLKCFALLERNRNLRGIYVNTVNCLPVCRAICARERSGEVKLIATDLFAGMAPFFNRGTILASIHGRPFAQGEVAVRLALDWVNGKALPPVHRLLPHVVMRSNLPLFREIHAPVFERPMADESFVEIGEAVLSA